MGSILSMCREKQRDNDGVAAYDDRLPTTTSTAEASPDLSSNSTQCSAISRAPSHDSYYFPSLLQVCGYSALPSSPKPIYSRCQRDSHIIHRCASNPYVAHAYNHARAVPFPSVHAIDPRQERLTPPVSTAVDNDENRTIADMTPTLDDQARLIKRSSSAAIDMFLIDISHEQIALGQPVSMNIRHLLLDTLQNHHAHVSAPVRIEPSTVTTYAHENLLDYIPYVCERYPNVLIAPDQLSRNTLHIRST